MHSSLHNGTPPPPSPSQAQASWWLTENVQKKAILCLVLRLECKGLSDMYHRRNILRFETS